MRGISWLSMAGVLVAVSVLHPAAATVIEYNLVGLGSDKYRYEYAVTNDTLGSSLGLFDILFDPVFYDEGSLTLASDASIAASWNESFFTSAPGVDATYDAFALGPGIADGATLSGFAVEFTWLGLGLPGAQSFEIYDPATFALIGQGFTSLASSGPGPTPIPEPMTLLLVALGAGVMVWYRSGAHRSRVAWQ